MNKIRWGILGCGNIARKFASDLKFVQDAELIALGARTQATADTFAKEFPATYVHGSYEALVSNPEVDVIYVATPHGLHYEHVMLCLQYKKAVLCEKAFAMNYREAKEMIDFAKAQNTFIMEAFWTRLLPPYLKMKELLSQDKVGTIKYLHADFGFRPVPPFKSRIYEPALGGGALLDIGVYPVFLALDVLGKPDHIEATMTPAFTGVDDQCSIQFQYKSGAIAQLFCSFTSHLATGADIAGDQGRIRFTHRFHGPTTQLEYYPTTIETKESISFEAASGFGYEYEARHVNECLRLNVTESPILTHEKTLMMMEVLDIIRSKAGIQYPADLRK